ncbi:uncharacterized protein LOC6725665 [Drosophila simulans]|uniref:GD17012 n=1 Tax=Drosophila simulans TaxID=7240 RepID=B4R2T1_DROSI|nr:uncharacterized protein LOC6725665 [Drosophila simulans]EDX17630.1 GD17012 [Drosophila simulans]KMZ09230.1 uncharacterized protein Dsimw501_GD17012 [Drosophila simulans]
MLKYLAGIFVSPRNDYENGRFKIPHPKKLAARRKSPPVKISTRSVINGGRSANGRLKTENRAVWRRREGNPHLPRPHSRSSQKAIGIRLDPISYIVNVPNSTSSLDDDEEEEPVSQVPNAENNLKVRRYRKKDFECLIPPPVSRVPSWTGPLNASPFNQLDEQDSIAGDADAMGWNAICLPDDFWSEDSDSEINRKLSKINVF